MTNPKPSYFVYILASRSRVLYIGQTNHLLRRLAEHKQKIIKGFTEKYNVDQLVYYEEFFTRTDAFNRERQLKGWSRQKKVELIESINPSWIDLSLGWGE